MKILYPDKVTAWLADEANAAYPDDNVADEHPKRVWKATSKDAEFKLTVSRGDCLYIGNTNATTITVTVKNSAEDTTLWGPTEYDLGGIDTYLELITDDGEAWDSLFVDYTYQVGEHKIIIDFEMASGVVECGILRAGSGFNFKDPKYGIDESLVDYSVTKELSNGAFYYRKRDVVREFSGTLQVQRDQDFYTYIKKVMTASGPAPFAVKLTEVDNHWWAVFVRPFMPSGSHHSPEWTDIDFTFREVI